MAVVPSDADREALLTAVAAANGLDPVAVRAGRRCPHCGSAEHGRPWATAAGRPVPVSLARTPARELGGVGTTAIAVVAGAVRSDVADRSPGSHGRHAVAAGDLPVAVDGRVDSGTGGRPDDGVSGSGG
ncbi:hypothetical protein NS263_14720 [Curtobacterium oceanosedimentum]|uniref:Uncharacterized protein n=1 Tax=Curtobacterium oceanosedimentum TaxID=465820 RepID=A0ABR5S2Y0_9MICO|nr:hypothetical protein NS263_14720 [Curtobacterium oceanosedimentum]